MHSSLLLANDESVFEKIFSRQQLLLNEEDQKKLVNARVALAGLGGIGSSLLEMLVRNGIANYHLADLDQYELTNARQLLMTHHTIGKHKVEVAHERVLSIIPSARVQIFNKGINPQSYREFCASADIICNETDQLTALIILNYAGNKLRKPVLHASRAKWPDRHLLTINVNDYRKNEVKFEPQKINFQEKWGVGQELIKELLYYIQKEENCPELLNEIRKQNDSFMRKKMLDYIEQGDCSLISDQDRAYLLTVAQKYPDIFHKMAISPEGAMTMGAMAAAIVKDIILNRPYQPIAIDLYHGKAMAPYYKEY